MNKHYVYESPDGGRTVYQREIGSSERTLTSDSLKYTEEILNKIREDEMWGNIRRYAKLDPALDELLSHAVVYYKLKYDEDTL